MDRTVSKALQACSPPYNMELGRASTEQVHLPSSCNSSTSSAMDVLCNMVSSCEQDGFLDQSMQHGAMHHIDKASSLLDILYYGGVGGSEPNKQLADLMDVEDNDHHNPQGHHIGLLHPALVHQGYSELRHFKLPLLEQEPEANENKEEGKTGVAAAGLQQQPTCSTASTEVRPSARRNLEMAIKKHAAPSVSCSADNQSGAGRAAIATAPKRAHLCSYEEDEDDDEEEDDDDVDDDERRKGCQQASKKMRLHATSAGEAPGPLPGMSKVNGGGQRMTHIAVERNRRKQMNEHLAILRSLMPNSYVQRGDQASIIGGVVEFIKELQQLLSSLEAQKRRRAYAAEAGLSPRVAICGSPGVSPCGGRVAGAATSATSMSPRGGPAPASAIEDLAAISRSELADVEVKLSGGANVSLRTLSHVTVRGQLLLLVAALQSLSLEILHLNITTLQRTVLYTFTLKIGIECRFSVDDLATAVQEIFRNIHTTNNIVPQ